MNSFFREVKRRNVYKVAVTYLVVGWFLIQIATQTFPFLEIPDWASRLVILVVVLGFPIALVIVRPAHRDRRKPGRRLVGVRFVADTIAEKQSPAAG